MAATDEVKHEKALSCGREVELKADSRIFRKKYKTEILEHDGRLLRVRIPLDEGKLVLLPVGTKVRVLLEGDKALDAAVADRLTGKEKCLVLSLGGLTRSASRGCTVYTVSSGKGGVGKTVFTANLGAWLATQGKKVCLIDGDLGTANIDVILNMSPRFNLGHVIAGEKSIFEVLVEGPHGLIVLPGGSGLQELTELDARHYARLMEEFRLLEKYADVILIDTAAGLSKGVTTFLMAADEGILITSPEPHAITDVYALMKVLSRHISERMVPLSLVVNRVRSRAEGESVAEKVTFAAQRFLGMNLRERGFIPDDGAVGDAVRKQCDFVTAYPRSRASLAIQEIGASLLSDNGENVAVRGGFLQRLWSIAKAGRG